eukprot:1184272-Rhodomonas_salina.1
MARVRARGRASAERGTASAALSFCPLPQHLLAAPLLPHSLPLKTTRHWTRHWLCPAVSRQRGEGGSSTWLEGRGGR